MRFDDTNGRQAVIPAKAGTQCLCSFSGLKTPNSSGFRRTTPFLLAFTLALAVVLPATASDAANEAPEPALVQALLSGRDTSAQAAQARAHGGTATKRTTETIATPLAQFQREVTALRAALARKAATDDSRLAPSLESLRATALLVEAEFDRIERQSASLDGSNVVRARLAQARTRWHERVGPLLSALDAAAHAPGNAKARQTALDALAAAHPEPAARTFGATPPPVHRPRLAPRAPRLQPDVAPSYATPAHVPVLPEDLAGTPDAPLSAAVREQAARLDNDYAAIFDYVRSQVRTEWRAGAAQHVDETLRRGAGNDAEQASLLIALLRASRTPARYVTGVVELPLADLAAQIGVPEAQVGTALAAAGIAHTPVIAAGRVTAFRIEHVWVSARVPFGNYRGSVAHADEPTWVPLMPALKPATFQPGTPLASVWPLDVPAFVTEYLSAPQDGLPWETLRQRLAAALAAQQPPRSLADLPGSHVPDAAPLGVLPASTPYPVVAVNLELHELLDEQRQWLTVRVRGGEAGDAPVLLEQRLALPQMASHRIALSYLPATVEDQHLANRRGGWGGFPAYLVRLRPTLTIGGHPAGAGQGIVEAGQVNRLELVLAAPGGELALSQTLLAGTLAVATIDPSGDPAVDTEPDAQDSDLVASRLLGAFAQRYVQEWVRADRDSAAILGVRLLHPLPSVALMLPQYRAQGTLGLVDHFAFDGVALDAAAHPVEPISLRGQAGDEADWLRLSALHGSALESHLYEQLWAVDALSADRALQLASERGIPVLHLSPGDGTGTLAAHPAPVRTQVQAWLARGYAIDIPRDPLTQGAWTGSAWRVQSDDGEAGYFLSGDYAGGVTVIPPGLWYFQDLAQILADPYAAEPNDDPLSAFLVQLDARAQHQVVAAGEWATEPLRAYVTDRGGRPVQGARVEFRVTRSGASLRSALGEGSVVFALTNHRGIAEAQLRAPYRGTGAEGGFIRLEGDVNYRRSHTSVVDLAVETRDGPLMPGEPFYSHMVAGEAVRLEWKQHEENVHGLSPGLAFKPYELHAYDAYDNEVSNHAVAISVSDTYTGPQCDGDFDYPGSAVFLPGQCPERRHTYAGLDCANSQIQAVTGHDGLFVNLVPSSIYNTQITLRAISEAGSIDQVLSTLNMLSVHSDNQCVAPGEYTVLPWGSTSPVYDIGRLNQTLPSPRYLQVVGTSEYSASVRLGSAGASWRLLDVDWDVLAGNSASLITVSGGSVSPFRPLGVGEMEFDLIAGPSPTRMDVRLNFVHDILVFLPVTITADLPPAWALDLPAPTLEPGAIDLDPYQHSTHPIRLTAPILPQEYVSAGITLQIVDADGRELRGCHLPDAPAGAACVLERGLRFEPGQEYSARYIVNPTSAYALTSDTAPVPLGRGIIGGFGGYDTPPDLDAFVVHQYPRLIELQTEVDTQTGYVCAAATRFVYALGQPATVDIAFYALDEDGQRGDVAWQAVPAQATAEGVHAFDLLPQDLAFGAYAFEIHATAGDVEERYEGRLIHREKRRGALPLSHPFAKGIDLYDGHAVVSVEDAAIGGRGPGLRFTRTYASHSGDDRTALGRGWSSDIDSQVLRDSCGTHTVVGGAGQGQRYFPAGQDGQGNTLFTPMNGFHGTLVGLVGGGFDFYAKDGTRYHYAEPHLRGPRLSFIEDTNGNRVTYAYGSQAGERVVQRLVDSAGRALNLRHELLTLTRPVGTDLEERETRLLLTGLDGPEGLSVRYAYDAHGNLVQVTRGGPGGGQRIDAYAYDNLAGLWLQDPDGNDRYYHFGFRLSQARNAIDGSERSYDYAIGWIGVPYDGGRTLLIPEQRVVTLTEPDGGTTTFDYAGLRGMAGTTTVVTDARGAQSTYTLNVWGGADRVVTPAGTTTTAWNLTHLQPDSITDALGTTTTYQYDAHGNRTQETIAHAHGTLTRTWSYAAPGAFAVPIKNRVLSATDARGLATQFSYDARGNLTGRSRGGITEQFAYAANGDRIRATNGAGESTHSQYDTWGHLVREDDAEGTRRSAGWDARGRLLWEADGTGARTDHAYDALDRPVRTTLPPEVAGQPTRAQRQIAYDDAARMRTETDELGRVTVTTHDAMGRPVSIRNAQNQSRTLAYDANGNLTRETDFRNHATTHDYDEANRRTRTQAPLGKTTAYTHDALGNVLTETTTGPNSTTRTAQYEYRHALNLRTHVRQAIDGTHWAETVTAYDGNGNATAVMDPNGHLTTHTYDLRDRLARSDAPEGRVTQIAYDAADRKTAETLAGPGLASPQQRTWSYDARGREIARTDAAGHLWRTTYDAADRPIARSNPQGATWRTTYDPRGRAIQASGPVEGQVTTTAYDAAGNRIQEDTPDGRRLTHTYDALNRRTASADQLGPVEALTYDADGHVLTRTDAEGRTTTSTWNALGQETSRTLPSAQGQSRTLAWTYDVHGAVLAETDANGHVTTHSYDDLGRRTGTTLPETEGIVHTRTWTYDPTGNVLTRTDANGHTTTHAYDGLNRKTRQTDPDPLATTQQWTFDAAGNVLAHTDRRGITTATTYDPENRPLQIHRDGLRIRTNTYDSAGNLANTTDANGEVTTSTYDAANRKLTQTRPLTFVRRWTYTPWDAIATATDADGHLTTHTYDLRQRLIEQTDPAGHTTTHTYDGVGNRTRTTRPGGLAWAYTFDEADRLVQVTSPEGTTTRYRHDAHGNRTHVIDAVSQTTTTTYDARHRPVQITHPGGTTERFAYDAEANPIEQTNASGRTIAHDYDALNRLTQRDYGNVAPGDVQQERWHYDPNGNITRIEQQTNTGTHVTERTWDTHERLIEETDRHHQITQSGYDAHGNRLTRTDAEGTTTTQPDRLNRTARLTAPDGSATAFEYTPEGRLTTLAHPNGATTQHTYDDAGRIQSIVHRQNGTQVSSTAYTYDARGNRIEETHTDTAGTRTIAYGYDDDDRLTSTQETAPDGSTTDTTYTLDRTGNRTREQVTHNGTTTKDVRYTYGPRQQLEQSVDAINGETIVYAYDANGALIEETRNGQTTTYRQNAQDRLATLTLPGAPPIHYAYDAEGRRIEKLTPTEGRRYVWDGPHIRRETNVTGNPLASYEWSGGRVLRSKQGSNVTYAQHDALRSPIRWTGTDGGDQGRTRYGAWGTTENQQGTVPPIGFQGYYLDAESGDYQAQQRYYRPSIGRFTRTDPWRGDELRPITLNPYVAFNANSLSWIDPDGRCGASAHVVGALVPGVGKMACDIVDHYTLGIDASHPEARGLVERYRTQQGVETLKLAGITAADLAKSNIDFLGSGIERLTGLDFGATRNLEARIDNTAAYLGNLPVNVIDDLADWTHEIGQARTTHDPDRMARATAPVALSALTSAGGFAASASIKGAQLAAPASKVRAPTVHVVIEAEDARPAVVLMEPVPPPHLDALKTVTISKSRFPESAQHIEDAVAIGKPNTLTIDRENAAARRRESLRGIETRAGLDRDEFPPAMFQEGGQGASVRHISPRDNRGAGACIGAQCRELPDGARVRIDVVD